MPGKLSDFHIAPRPCLSPVSERIRTYQNNVTTVRKRNKYTSTSKKWQVSYVATFPLHDFHHVSTLKETSQHTQLEHFACWRIHVTFTNVQSHFSAIWGKYLQKVKVIYRIEEFGIYIQLENYLPLKIKWLRFKFIVKYKQYCWQGILLVAVTKKNDEF